jgi:hypothetical protein
MQRHFQSAQIERIIETNLDENDCSFFTITRTGQRIPTRGFKDGKSLGKRNVGLSKPQPTASQFKEGHCSCCKQAHLTPECPKFKSLSNQKQSTIIRRDKISYHCLEGPHLTRECENNEGKLCARDGCELYHHRVLHRQRQSVSLRAYRLRQIEHPITAPRELAAVKTANKILKRKTFGF